MRKSFLVLVLLLLMALNPVSGAKIDCIEKVHIGDIITCTVYGEGNVSIKLLSIDGYKVSGSFLISYQSGEMLYPNSDGFYTGKGSFTVEIPSGEVISFVYRGSDYCCEKWVFYDKWHTLTFVIKDGKEERVTAKVFIDGDVLSTIWNSIKPVLPLIFIAIIVAFYKDLLEIARLATGKAPRTKPEKKETPKGPSRWLYGLTLYAILVISLYTSLVILYFLGSPENMEGDFSILIPSLIATFLLLLFREEANTLEEVGKGYTLKKPALTGVEIVPISLITYGEHTAWLGILAFYVALFINRYELLNRVLRVIALPASVGWVFYILKSIRADSVFTIYFASIAMLFPLYIWIRVSRADEIPESSSEEEAQYVKIKRALERATKRGL
ncbi:hypothetical protein [Thermococcus sp.]|uniref:hypothetical protein n=1 Tax=Thermococcus sp. TaxID=35749 RepID=UPI0026325788|nr:hypothetical protein [Thermococcus sp.]